MNRAAAFPTALLLAVAVLFAQWLGMHHRIEHADRVHVEQVGTATHDGDTDHSCQLYDAASLADMAPFFPCIAPLLASVRVLALWSAFRSWHAPLTLHFQSRGPPPSFLVTSLS